MLHKPVLNHGDYNKITDDVYMLDLNVMLKMSVVLYTGKGDYRVNYHREFGYYDKNVNREMHSVRRTYDYFLSIENTRAINGYKEFIRIGPSEIMLVRRGLENVIRWFNDKEFENLFGYRKGKLVTARSVDPISISELPMRKYLVFEPIVVEYNDTRNLGVRMYISSTDNYIDVPINRFMGFVHTIFDINMFMCAQIMLSYFGRPEFGTNLHSFNTVGDDEVNPSGGRVEGRTMRQIPTQSSNKSLFDKLE